MHRWLPKVLLVALAIALVRFGVLLSIASSDSSQANDPGTFERLIFMFMCIAFVVYIIKLTPPENNKKKGP